MARKKILRKKPTYAFIDAANLFYGGEKSLGWKIDYQKLFKYLKKKYKVSKIFYYAGVEIYDFHYSVLDKKPIDLKMLYLFLDKKLKEMSKKLSRAQILLLDKNLAKIKFYRKIEKFGYTLKLKPVKFFKQDDGSFVKKANCDVDLAFDLMRLIEQYGSCLILSGDGDFAVVLKYLKSKGREITILARGGRTAKEIKQLAGSNFRDFCYLRELLKFKE